LASGHTDGDTITVLVHQRQVKVRLESIDAPESKQTFGKRSQQSLARLCAAKTATVHVTGKDRYGRTLGWVTCDGLDASSEEQARERFGDDARKVEALERGEEEVSVASSPGGR
jgi:endonuclease YncB( thermonuclease family)